jgi:hypothetical protein
VGGAVQGVGGGGGADTPGGGVPAGRIVVGMAAS